MVFKLVYEFIVVHLGNRWSKAVAVFTEIICDKNNSRVFISHIETILALRSTHGN